MGQLSAELLVRLLEGETVHRHTVERPAPLPLVADAIGGCFTDAESLLRCGDRFIYEGCHTLACQRRIRRGHVDGLGVNG